MTLQQQAENLISELGLIEKLATFGETHIVGSVAFGTTTKPDIDIQIYCNLHYEDAGALISNELANLEITDIKQRRLKKSKKYLILGKFLKNDTEWAIDITLTQPDKRYIRDSYHFYQDFSPKLNDEKKKMIVELKKAFTEEKILGDNCSYYIYLGVLNEGITTQAEMKRFLERIKGKKQTPRVDTEHK